jgi:hypothetical protein
MGECPTTFVPYQGACVRQCPQDKFSFVTDNNQPRCVSKSDGTKKVNLIPVNAIAQVRNQPVPTLQSLQQSDPSRYSLFKTEADRVDAEIAVILSQMDKTQLIQDAFRQLQQAENVRDQSPEAYGRARVAYYSLTQGPEWIEGEKKRVATVEVDPQISIYRNSFESLKTRQQNQQQTQDIMNSVKDGVLTLKDDFQYTTKLFKDQIEKLKNQINIERRGRETPVSETSDFYKWVDALLNLFIIAGLLYVAFVFWRKLRAQPQPAYAPITVNSQ